MTTISTNYPDEATVREVMEAFGTDEARAIALIDYYEGDEIDTDNRDPWGFLEAADVYEAESVGDWAEEFMEELLPVEVTESFIFRHVDWEDVWEHELRFDYTLAAIGTSAGDVVVYRY